MTIQVLCGSISLASHCHTGSDMAQEAEPKSPQEPTVEEAGASSVDVVIAKQRRPGPGDFFGVRF